MGDLKRLLVFVFSQSLAPKESTVVRTQLFPARLGVSRLYVTFISDSIHSTTQIIPLEIVREAIEKKPKQQLTSPAKDVPKKGENENKSPVEAKEKPAAVEEPKPLATTPSSSTVESDSQQKNPPASPPIKLDSPASGHEDDDVEELYLRKDHNRLQSNNSAATSSIPHGSTLSLDKDKMSIDSLDISNDRRNQSHNNHP